MAQKYFEIIKKIDENRVKQNEPLSVHTTFKIGGPADLFYEARTIKELVEAIKLSKKLKVPYFVLGGGSNVLVADEGFRGLVIKIKNKGFLRNGKLKIQNYKITAEAGVFLGNLVELATKNSLTGLEFLAGIPGTIGGAVRGNAGAWQQSIGEEISRVRVLTPDGKIKWLEKDNCHFDYRQSRFKKNKEIILEIELELRKGNKNEIEEKIRENLEKRKSQPSEPSAGCIFVNPKPDSAGNLIEQCGLKGKRIGNAQISEKHANWIVNLGGAKAKDVVQLIKLAKMTVKKKFRIDLHGEISLIGFDKIIL